MTCVEIYQCIQTRMYLYAQYAAIYEKWSVYDKKYIDTQNFPFKLKLKILNRPKRLEILKMALKVRQGVVIARIINFLVKVGDFMAGILINVFERLAWLIRLEYCNPSFCACALSILFSFAKKTGDTFDQVKEYCPLAIFSRRIFFLDTNDLQGLEHTRFWFYIWETTRIKLGRDVVSVRNECAQSDEKNSIFLHFERKSLRFSKRIQKYQNSVNGQSKKRKI